VLAVTYLVLAAVGAAGGLLMVLSTPTTRAALQRGERTSSALRMQRRRQHNPQRSERLLVVDAVGSQQPLLVNADSGADDRDRQRLDRGPTRKAVTFEPSPAVAPQHVVDLDVVAAAGSLARLSRRVSAERFSTAREETLLAAEVPGNRAPADAGQLRDVCERRLPVALLCELRAGGLAGCETDKDRGI
jgi:hypothetical protein